MKNLSPTVRFLLVIVFVIFSQLSAQSRVNEWKHYTSIIDFTNIIGVENKVFCSSSGGIVEFDLDTKQFQTYDTDYGLSRISLETIAMDSLGNIWIGSGEPVGEINIFSPESKSVIKVFDSSIWNEELSTVNSIAIANDKAFAVYSENSDYGILEFEIGNGYTYKDYYVNFPIVFQEMSSVSIAGDNIYLTTSAGLICADYENSDLKGTESWVLVDSSEYVTNAVSFDDKVLYGKGKRIYSYDGTKSQYYLQVSGTIQSLSVENGLLLVSSTSGLYSIDTDKSINQLVDGKMISGIAIDDTYIANSDGNGLFVIQGTDVEQYMPNTFGSNANTAVCVDNQDRIIVGSKYGFGIKEENGWKNIVRTNGIVSIHENESDYSSFFADSIAYSSCSRIYSIVQRSDGSVFASIYGADTKNGQRGALIKFNPDDLTSYELFDSTDGNLATSEGHGGSDHYYGVGRMQLDEKDNLWICNQYADNDNAIAVLKNDDTWLHFSISNSGSKLTYDPTCIAFDNQNRVWIGSESNDRSSGKIAILDYNNTLDDKTDDTWYSVTTSSGLASNNIYDLAFDHNGTLFILTDDGIQEAEVNTDFSDGYFASIDANSKFSNLSFSKENVIKIDGQNNKWITTASSGVLVYTYDNQWLNDYEGYNIDNSDLLSNEIQDIDFIEEEGLVVMTTNKGISVLKSQFSTEKDDFDKLKIFPMPFKVPEQQELVIEGLLPGSDVKILTLDGTFVRELTEDNGEIVGTQAFWDGRNKNGKLVSSGVYICTAYTEEKNIAGKIAVIRKR